MFFLFLLAFMQFSCRGHQELIAVLKTGDYFGEARRTGFTPWQHEREENDDFLSENHGDQPPDLMVKLINIPRQLPKFSPCGNLGWFRFGQSIYYVGTLCSGYIHKFVYVIYIYIHTRCCASCHPQICTGSLDISQVWQLRGWRMAVDKSSFGNFQWGKWGYP